MAKKAPKNSAVTNPEIPQAAMITKTSGVERLKTKRAVKRLDETEGLNDSTQCSV